MSMKLYDLCGADEDHRFSPFCWRAKMALHHKGLAFDAIATPFTKIPEVEGGATKTVPLLVDDGHNVVGSFEIALHLEEKFPDQPSLFGGKAGIALSRFVESWTNTVVNPGVAGIVVKNVHDVLAERDQIYFRESRETRLGATLEDVHSGRDGRIDGFKLSLNPLRMMLGEQSFIGGDAPLYADYIVYGTLKWLHTVSDIEVLDSDDTVLQWFNGLDVRFQDLKAA